ncbi:MAG: hypothetical protein ACP5G7_02310 [Anaerolineae bacterium]
MDLSLAQPWLERLEQAIDMEHVRRTSALQRAAFAFEPVPHIPTVIHYPVPEEEWPRYTFPEIYRDPVKMLLHELTDVYEGTQLRDDRLYGIRANYGTGIVASMFGAPTVVFDETLPIGQTVTPAALQRILESDPPKPHTGLAARALDTVALYREALAPYPNLRQAIGSQMLDIQGPFDNATILWGSTIYYAFYDAPERLYRLMQLIVDATLALVEEHRHIDGCPVTEHDGAWKHLGGLCVRNDSSVTLSSAQYESMVRPHDERLLARWGGWIHFCGKASWWEKLLAIPNLHGINPYQGEFYDLHGMYERCEAAGIPIIQWMTPLDAASRDRIRTGLSRIIYAPDQDTAKRLLDRLHRTGHADSEETLS